MCAANAKNSFAIANSGFTLIREVIGGASINRANAAIFYGTESHSSITVSIPGSSATAVSVVIYVLNDAPDNYEQTVTGNASWQEAELSSGETPPLLLGSYSPDADGYSFNVLCIDSTNSAGATNTGWVLDDSRAVSGSSGSIRAFVSHSTVLQPKFGYPPDFTFTKGSTTIEFAYLIVTLVSGGLAIQSRDGVPARDGARSAMACESEEPVANGRMGWDEAGEAAVNY